MPDQMPVNTWDLQVPVRLSLAPNEISSPGRVPPVYLMASRQGYLQPLAQQAHQFFQHARLQLPGQGNINPWFQYQSLQLLWRLPTGVLVDLLLGPAPQLPWHLDVHYQQPSSSSGPAAWQNQLDARGDLLNSLKEAAYICRGSEGAKAIMNMEVAAQDALWAAVEGGDGPAYRHQLAQLKLMPTQRQGAGPFVPVRVLLRDRQMRDLWVDTSTTTRPAPALQPDGQYTHLGHLLQLVAPHLAPIAAAVADLPATRPPASGTAASSGRQPAAAAAAVSQPPAEGSTSQATAASSGAGGTQSDAGAAGGSTVGSSTTAGAAHPLGQGPAGATGQSAEGGADPLGVGARRPQQEQQSAVSTVPSSSSSSSSSSAPGDLLIGAAQAGQQVPAASSNLPEGAPQPPPTATDAAAGAAGDASPGASAATSAPAAQQHAGQPQPPQSEQQVQQQAGHSKQQQPPGPPAPSPAAAGPTAVPNHPGLVVLVSGIQPPLHTPLAWLHAHLHGPDYFLYVVVHCHSS